MLLFELLSPSRTLYVHRNLLNADDVIEWAKAQGIKATLPVNKFHATIAYSKKAVIWDEMPRKTEKLRIIGGERSIEHLGKPEEPVLVLKFRSDVLRKRWQEFIDTLGCSWDYDNYQSHVTLTYDGGDYDPKSFEPYSGPFVFGPEMFAEVDEDYKEKVEEISHQNV